MPIFKIKKLLYIHFNRPVKIRATPLMININFAKGIFPAKPTKPREVTVSMIIGPITARHALILKAVSTLLKYIINPAAESSTNPEITLNKAIPKTIFKPILSPISIIRQLLFIIHMHYRVIDMLSSA